MRTGGVVAGLVGLLTLALVAAFSVGPLPVGLAEVFAPLRHGPAPAGAGPTAPEAVFWQLRFPRVVAAGVIGAALAASGAALQQVFRNPLASPDLLGVSSGAALGAVIGIFLGWSLLGLQAAAFAGGLIAVALVHVIAGALRVRDRVLALLLTGVAVGSLLGALIAVVQMLSDPVRELPAITFWMMGSFASVTGRDLPWLCLVCAAGVAPLALLRWRADALALTDDEVRTLGIGPTGLRLALTAGATLATASCVAAAGIVGWVGLVVPHAARLLVGASFPRVLPVSMLLGATLMLAIDAAGRGLATAELPPGVLSALVGAPILFVLMLRGRRV